MNTTYLEDLSDKEPRASIKEVHGREKEAEVNFLYHLVEIERRSLHLEWGYSSLFTYMTKSLGYSEASTSRRVRVSRVITQYPVIVPLMRSGVVNLTTLSQIAKIITQNNKHELLTAISHKSSREVEEIVLKYQEVVGSKYIQKTEKITPVLASTIPSKSPTKSLCNRQGSSSPCKPSSEARKRGAWAEAKEEQEQPIPQELRYEIRCNVSKELKGKIDRLKSMLSHKCPEGVSVEDILEEVVDEYIERHGEQEKAVRAKKRKARGKSLPPKEKVSAREHIPLTNEFSVFSSIIITREGYATR